MFYAGLDVHKAFTFGVVKGEKGEVLNKAKFENSEENFDVFFKGFPPGEMKIVMESTGVWEYIYEILDGKGYTIKLANPVRTKAIASAKIKTDAIDAATLADLLRADLIAESYVPTKDVRRLRDVVRQRRAIVEGRTQIKNKIHAILIRNGVKLPYKSLGPKAVNWLHENIDVNDILVSYFNLLEQFNNELKFVDEHIKAMAEKDEQSKLLMTIPGIGPVISLELIAEIADIKRFPNSSKLCSYAGLVPEVKQSGNSLRHGRLIRQANRSIKNSLIQASWAAVKTKEAHTLKLHYLRLKDKKCKQKAICATARKMLCIVYAMLTKEQEFKS